MRELSKIDIFGQHDCMPRGISEIALIQDVDKSIKVKWDKFKPPSEH